MPNNLGKKKVSIIGAGMIGLSLAYFLLKKGHQVCLIEKDKELGGVCSWIRFADIFIDKFYHVLSTHDKEFLGIARDLGVDKEIKSANPKLGCFWQGRSYPIANIKNFLDFPLLNYKDKAMLAMAIARARIIRSWRSLENISAREWLVKLCGRNVYEKLWYPIMRLKFGDCLEDVNATDMWLRINRMSSLRTLAFQEKSLYLNGSMKTFLDRMETSLLAHKNSSIRKGVRVSNILERDSRCLGLKLEDGDEIESDLVICTAALPEFSRLMPDKLEDLKSKISHIRYLGNVCLLLKLSRPLTPFYMLGFADTDFPFTGVIGLSNLYRSEYFHNSHIFYVTKYISGDYRGQNFSRETVFEEYLQYIKKLSPNFSPDWVEDYALVNEPYVEPLHCLGYSQLIPPIATRVKNLYLACNAQIYPDVTVVNMAVKFAKKIASEIIF